MHSDVVSAASAAGAPKARPAGAASPAFALQSAAAPPPGGRQSDEHTHITAGPAPERAGRR
jgi:hypothetical protein